MNVQFDFRGGMIVRDNLNKIHLFEPCEVKEIQTAIYRYVQKKGERQYNDLL